jgi:hypothetical protein
MKHKLILLAVALVALLSFITPAYADPATDPVSSETTTVSSGGGGGGGSSSAVLPIYRQDALRNYALTLVVSGSRYLYADTMDWDFPKRVTWGETNGNGAEDVLRKLSAQNFVFRLLNSNDTVNGYEYLRDKNGSTLFYGYTSFTLDDTNKPVYQIWMNEIPILSNVESAEILILDEDGKTARRESLKVNEFGQLMFPSWYAGSPNGVMAVSFKDGAVATYPLADPRRNTPGVNVASPDFVIDGHHLFTDVSVVKIIELWRRPTVYLELSTDTWVTFDVMGLVQDGSINEFERPTAVQVDGQWYELPADGKLYIKAGAHRTLFKWNRFGEPGLIYTGPIGSTEKG